MSFHIKKDGDAWTIVTVTVVMLGKSFIAVSFAIIYNYTAELFPTVVRSSAVGVGSSSARLAGMIAPQILLLVSRLTSPILAPKHLKIGCY